MKSRVINRIISGGSPWFFDGLTANGANSALVGFLPTAEEVAKDCED